MSHILGSRSETLSFPWYTDFTNGLENSETCLRLYRLFGNIIHDGWRYIFADTNISVARD